MKVFNWPRVLADEIRRYQKIPFEWGTSDCCMFPADVIKAITGEDFAAEFRGRYQTEMGSLRALKRYGKGSIEATIDSKYERNDGLPSRGDLATVVTENGTSLAVVGVGCVWAMTLEGVDSLPLSEVAVSWRVD